MIAALYKVSAASPDMTAMRFEDIRIDLHEASVTRDGQHIALTPKAFDVLAHLATHAGMLVSKNELLDAVWQRRYISEGVIKNAIQELRGALGDDPRTPRYIETVHRRGYRFIAKPETDMSAAPVTLAHEAVYDPLLVGRDAEMKALMERLAQTVAGKTSIVFLRGEPGIGKTTLLHVFMRHAEKSTQCISGQCIEQYGQGEPYLPLLDAISQLTRDSDEECLRLMRRTAPSWLAQLPWLVDAQEQATLMRETRGVTRERMLRELGEFMRAWTADHPLVLTLEDLHWSDHATLDAINYLARRKDGARLMLLGSYRPADVAMSGHPFATMRGELLLHGLCREIPLSALSEEDVGDYLQQRFPADTVPDATRKAIFERTEGLPLFMARVTDEFDLDERNLGQLLQRLPEGLKHLIDLQVDRLPAEERQWLEIAAVCGDSFSPQILSDVSGTALDRIEHWSEQQAQSQHLLRHAHATPQPARIAQHYRFIHAYYQERLYARIAPTRRADLHRSIGERLEAQTRSSPTPPAAELAVHFERGLEFERAVSWQLLAAKNALARHATHEAAALLQHGLSLLDTHLPETPEHQQTRLEYLSLLAPALIAVRGYGIPELEAIYQRALDLSVALHSQHMQFFTLYGKWMFHLSRGELDVTLHVARRLADIAAASHDKIQEMAADLALATTLMFQGAHRRADEYFEEGIAIAIELGETCDRLTSVLGQDPLSSMQALQAVTAQTLGEIDRANRLMRLAWQRAQYLSHPFTMTYLLFCMIWMARDGKEDKQVRQWLPEFERLSVTHGFPVMINTVDVFAGWALATMEHDCTGIDMIEQSIIMLGVHGTRLTKTVYYYQLADACFSLGRYEESLKANELAMSEAEFSGERRYESSIWRQRAELLNILGGRNGETTASCLDKARHIAAAQDARLLELRTACTGYRLAAPADREEAARRLRAIQARFTEGFNSPFMQEAQALLQEYDEKSVH